MFKKEILSILTVAILALAASEVQAVLFNGGFEIYKPGTDYTVTGTLGGPGVFDSYAQGVGDGLFVNGGVGTAIWDDGSGTTPMGGPVDLPGWDKVLEIRPEDPNFGNPKRNPDTGKNGVGGSEGLNIFAAWGGQQRVQSSVVETDRIAANTTYTITAQIDGPAGGPIEGDLAFDLLAGDIQLTADAALPSFIGGSGFQTIARTYTIGALPDGVSAGDPLTVVLGVQDSNDIPNRMIWDDVTLAGAGPTELLTLEINTTTGATTILGDDDTAIDINFYEITSAGDSLDPDGWSSLEEQDNAPDFPAGDGTGNGWEESGGIGTHALAEGWLEGSSTIAAAASVGLGNGYDVGVGAKDLVFTYRTDTAILEGLVDYVIVPPGSPGDYNNSGQVEQGDLDLVLLNWGDAIPGDGVPAGWINTDFPPTPNAIDQDDLDGVLLNWGDTSGTASVVPEPTSLGLFVLGALALLGGARDRQ